MRAVLVLLVLAGIALAGCKREAQEAVAEAKGAAADAQRAANDVAAQAKATADEAAAKAKAQAQAAADQARSAAASVDRSAREGIHSAGQSVSELTAGNVLTGVLVGASASELTVHPTSGTTQFFGTDSQTRWMSKGSAADRGSFPVGSTVRVTYIVRNGKKLATQVEVLTR